MKSNDIEQLTNCKWVNLYKVEKEFGSYYFCSRNTKDNLEILNKNKQADAVRILPYVKKNNKIYLVLEKEYRTPLDKYIYGTPAGLIDKGETPIESAKRELYEEIGANVVSIEQLSNKLYSSAGLTDESVIVFFAQVELTGTQHLEKSEDIKYELVDLDNVQEFLKDKDFCAGSFLLIQYFYYKQKMIK